VTLNFCLHISRNTKLIAFSDFPLYFHEAALAS
jgi:hypothetical protein